MKLYLLIKDDDVVLATFDLRLANTSSIVYSLPVKEATVAETPPDAYELAATKLMLEHFGVDPKVFEEPSDAAKERTRLAKSLDYVVAEGNLRYTEEGRAILLDLITALNIAVTSAAL